MNHVVDTPVRTAVARPRPHALRPFAVAGRVPVHGTPPGVRRWAISRSGLALEIVAGVDLAWRRP